MNRTTKMEAKNYVKSSIDVPKAFCTKNGKNTEADFGGPSVRNVFCMYCDVAEEACA
ncbi:hypothetical protein Sjap_017452 [Stephania japonica]|uniref:Uncharacterized protein n=1 Tax=Stephania japonica TaxID=461633 RepID=A0AAP0I674_9MAGN